MQLTSVTPSPCLQPFSTSPLERSVAHGHCSETAHSIDGGMETCRKWWMEHAEMRKRAACENVSVFIIESLWSSIFQMCICIRHFGCRNWWAVHYTWKESLSETQGSSTPNEAPMPPICTGAPSWVFMTLLFLRYADAALRGCAGFWDALAHRLGCKISKQKPVKDWWRRQPTCRTVCRGHIDGHPGGWLCFDLEAWQVAIMVSYTGSVFRCRLSRNVLAVIAMIRFAPVFYSSPGHDGVGWWGTAIFPGIKGRVLKQISSKTWLLSDARWHHRLAWPPHRATCFPSGSHDPTSSSPLFVANLPIQPLSASIWMSFHTVAMQ